MSDRDSDYAYESDRNRSDYAFNQQQERYGGGVDALGEYQRGQDAALATWATARDEPERSRSSTPGAPSSSSEGWGLGGGGYSAGGSSPAMTEATARYERRKHAPKSPLRTVVAPLLIGGVLLAMAPSPLIRVFAVWLVVGAGYNALKLYSTRRAHASANDGGMAGIPGQVPPAPTASHVPPYAVPPTAPAASPASFSRPQTAQGGAQTPPSAPSAPSVTNP